AVGAFLGVHLLVAASRTFGHGVRVDAPGAYLGAIAYDVGLSALTAEWLFRGALFSRWWRQWPFGTAAALSVGCAVLRYVLDPNLPPAAEMRLGAAFYPGRSGGPACARRAWSGSALPGYRAPASFFLAYRALSTWGDPLARHWPARHRRGAGVAGRGRRLRPAPSLPHPGLVGGAARRRAKR